MRRISLALLPALALGACTFISQTTYQEALCQLDEDGDGDPRCGASGTTADGDCDDTNPLMFNGNVETPYDGLDNDCQGSDLLDVDGDGYPGISREDYEALPVHEPWPQGMPPEFDCQDLPIPDFPEGYETNIYPGAPEIWYDGLDGNCAGNDDFDQDFDGFASAAYADVYTGDLPATDCMDTDPDVYPGSPIPNEPYDGVDQDCSGLNVYDPDGDGRLTPGYNADAATFVSRYSYELTWIPDADCMDIGDRFHDDEVDPDLAARTHRRTPGEDCPSDSLSCEETWYDGYDDACDDVAGGRVVRNDFDQDGDGFLRRSSDPDADRAAFLAYVDRYRNFTNSRGEQPYRAAFESTFGSTEGEILDWFNARSNDCDDTDPAINPLAIERLGDGVDRDCDGDPDTTPFDFGPLTWFDPGPVRAIETEEHVSMVVSATDGIDLGDGSGRRTPRSVALSWGESSRDGADYTADETPFAPTAHLSKLDPLISTYAIGDGYITSHSWYVDRHRLRASRSNRDRVTTANYRVSAQADSGTRFGTPTPYLGHDIRCEDGLSGFDICWSVACDEVSVQFMVVETSTSFTRSGGASFDVIDPSSTIEAQACFALPSSLAPEGYAIGVLDTSGAFTALEDDGTGDLQPATGDPFPTDEGYRFGRSHQDWLILGRETGGLILWGAEGGELDILSDLDLIDADAVVTERDGSPWLTVAALTTGGELVLAYGSPSSLSRQVLPVDGDEGPLSIDSVAVAANGDRVIVAARGLDGSEARVAWSLFKTP